MTLKALSGRRIGVVGAGVIGLSCAHALLVRGAEVRVFDRGRAGRGASWAAAGMLAPSSETLEAARTDPEESAFAHESLALWPRWADALAASSGRAFGFAQDGSITPALDVAAARSLRSRAARAEQMGLAAQLLDPDAARALEPSLSRDVRQALFAPEEARVDPRALVEALIAAVCASGGSIEEGVEVRDVASGARPALLHADAVGAGDVQSQFDLVVLAPGWRAPMFAHVLEVGGRALARVTPVKGQALLVAAGEAAPRRTLRGDGIYVTPREDGRVVIGATMEPGLADATVRPDAIARLHAGAARLAPGLADAAVLETWAGVRPGLEGGAPWIGEAAPGVLAAVGHHRNGILLAPATARRIAELAELRLGAAETAEA